MQRKADEESYDTGTISQHFVRHQPRIVIVGAGAAGLATAQCLLEHGFHNFVIVEAQDRIGGRVWTVGGENGYVEMGAQFLHGNSPLYEVAERNKVIRDVGAYADKEVNPIVELGSGGEFLSDKEHTEGDEYLKQIFDETYLAITSIVEDCKYHQLVGSLGKVILEQFEVFLAHHVNEPEKVLAYRRSILDWLIRSHRVDNACVSLSEVCATEYSKYAGGLINLPLTIPMSTTLGLCVPNVPADKVMLSTPVRQIKFRRHLKHPVQIECENGLVLQADHCIVTASLGFLKKNHSKMFKPALPEEKKQAIEKAGYGTVDKIFVRFPYAFWEKKYGAEVDGFQLLFSEAKPDRAWYESILGFDVSRTLPNTLVGWVAGREAEEMEKMSKEEVGQICKDVLQKFMKDVDVPMPVDVIIPNWNSNPYTCGSYSYAAAGQTKHIEALMQPVWNYINELGVEAPGLMFAGEATSPTLFSTVPGALESGRREAERLIGLYTIT